jgi:hypothetical protein
MIVDKVIAKHPVEKIHQISACRPVTVKDDFEKFRTLRMGIKHKIPIITIKTHPLDKQQICQDAYDQH